MESTPLPDEADSRVLAGRVAELAQERGALFDKASRNLVLSKADQDRLHSIERELDECFLSRRRQRAQLDARRFDREGAGMLRVPVAKPAQ